MGIHISLRPLVVSMLELVTEAVMHVHAISATRFVAASFLIEFARCLHWVFCVQALMHVHVILCYEL